MNSRDPWLDFLRGLAVCLVVLAHLRVTDDCPRPIIDFLSLFQKAGGRAGVELFFVLSGFLVSGLLFQEWSRMGKVGLGRFLVRRGFKIYPPFWCVLGFIIAVRWWKGHETPAQRLFGELLFLQNYLGRLAEPHWTLAVEEHFYLLLVGLFAWQIKTKSSLSLEGWGRRVIGIYSLLLVCSICARLLTDIYDPSNFDAVSLMTHACVDSLFLGVLLAWGCRVHNWHTRIQAIVRPLTSSLIATGCLTLVCVGYHYKQGWVNVFGISVTTFAAALLLLSGVNRPFNLMGTSSRIVCSIGISSYSIYLWHMPWILYLLPLLEKHLPWSSAWWSNIALSVVGSLILGRMMVEVVERPMLRLRDQWFPPLAKFPNKIA